jgi:hypothetical protein
MDDMKRRKMSEDIENAVSRAMTAPEDENVPFMERLMDFAERKAMEMERIRDEAYGKKPKDYIQKKRAGGKVTKVRKMKGGGCVMAGRGGSYKGMR